MNYKKASADNWEGTLEDCVCGSGRDVPCQHLKIKEKNFVKMLAFVWKPLYNNPCVTNGICAFSSVGRAPDS